MNKRNQPPQWATRFLRWYCNKQIAEDLEGDLNELYFRNVTSKGLTRARLIYIADVLKFLRIYTVQKPDINNPAKHLLLIKNYFKTSSRNLRHNLLFSFINVLGLAISMSVGLLLITFISEIYTFDKFHEDADRIYRINNSYEYLGEADESRYASTSAIIEERMRESIPGVENLTILRRHSETEITYKDKTVSFPFLWASEEFFEIFSFKLLEGNPKTALKELNSIVITDQASKKLFGEDSPLNKEVLINDETYAITGVVATPPRNSHLQFGILGSYATFVHNNKQKEHEFKWANMWNYYVYFKLKEGRDPASIQAGLDKISEEENRKIDNTVIKVYMQPLPEIVPGVNLNNGIGTTMEIKMVRSFILLFVVVLVSACFNYTNLSLSRSMRRSMEVGIRKVNGASGFQVWLQFIVEAIIIAVMALILAIGFFIILRNYFFVIDHRMDEIVTLQLTPELIGYFVLLALVVGLIAGFFPALFYSRLSVFKVLKGSTGAKVFKQFNFRKILILLQYTISVAFIVAVTLIYRQYRYSLSFDLGYDTENIINLRLFGKNPTPLKNELRQYPEIKNISQSGLVTSTGSYWGQSVKYKDPLDSSRTYYNEVDENYLPIHGHQFLAGGNFVKSSDHDSTVNNQVIVNEALLKILNIGSPEQAIGEEVLISGKKKIIQGVLKDFHFGRLDTKIAPFTFLYGTSRNIYLNLLVETDDLFTTMNKIEGAWKQFDPVHPPQASFYDDQIKKAYEEYASMVTIMAFMAILAISIASMGLLGMVVFSTQSRLKEIGIRKVFGASEFNLVYLLGKGFVLLLILAAAIAIPLTYYYVDTVVFEEIVYKANFGFFDIISGVWGVIAIALMAICIETFKAARTNPAKILRDE